MLHSARTEELAATMLWQYCGNNIVAVYPSPEPDGDGIMNFGPLLLAVAVVSLDVQRAARVIRSGGVFVQPGWVAPAVSCALRADALALREAGAFAPSGVSNVASATKPFGSEDRVCCTLHERVGGDAAARRGVEVKLEVLRAELGVALGRDVALEEMYYSIHGAGAFLGRHMDERHEACKGEAGFLHDTRRSVSWLVYLQQAKRGGELRAWCRESAGDVGAHEGDVQVGWLPRNRRDAARRRATPRAARRRAAPAATAAPSAVDPSKNRGNPSRSRRAARGFAGPRARPSGFGRFRPFPGTLEPRGSPFVNSTNCARRGHGSRSASGGRPGANSRRYETMLLKIQSHVAR